ncbi:hypothetical protein MY11210_004689 [Beauveria gryllotalpidicola]
MAAANEDFAFHLPKLRSSFSFENDTRFLNNGDDVPGGGDAKVKIYDVRTCTLVNCFAGHGGAFHATGRYLVSGGHDQVINLWTMPDLPTEPVVKPLQVHYPHFSTSAVHSGIVDCVSFCGDCILSRACHDNVIVLWRIEGFSSEGPPPPQSDAPTAQAVVPTSLDDQSRLTRSYFVPATTPECPSQYTRLLEFHTPNCGPQFFMRFGLHHVPGQNPVLAFCNAGGNILFWDLHRLSVYHDVMLALHDPRRDRTRPRAPMPTWLKAIIPRQRADMFGRIKGVKEKRGVAAPNGTRQSSVSSSRGGGGAPESASSAGGAEETAPEFSAETLESWAAKYSMEDPHEPVKAHRTESSTATFVGRQAAWSPGGEWCVVVGSSNTTLVLQRWAN